jgi:large subunit ribosomal protein L17
MTTPKLGRKKEHRERTLRNVATSLFLYEQVTTTEAKAKAVTPMVERLVTTALKGTIAARRTAKALLFDMNAVTKLFEDVPARAGTRTSGFVRLTKLPTRPGDGAAMARMELLFTPIEEMVAKESKTSVKVRRAPKAATTEEPKETN